MVPCTQESRLAALELAWNPAVRLGEKPAGYSLGSAAVTMRREICVDQKSQSNDILDEDLTEIGEH